MSESLIVSLSQKSSKLETTYFLSIELASEKNYVLGLVELLPFDSIPNIDSRNNKFHIVYLIGSLFGFTPRSLHADTVHVSNKPVPILKVTSLRAESKNGDGRKEAA